MKFVVKVIFYGLIAVFILKLSEIIMSTLESRIPFEIEIGVLSATILLACAFLLAREFFGSVRHKADKDKFKFWSANQRRKTAEMDHYGFTMKPVDGRQRILTLSGGGYKAGLFHLGSLRALNLERTLASIDAFASVSGGSITNAWLGSNWSKLQFDETGKASNFDALIYEPLLEFYTNVTIDAPAILARLVPGVSAPDEFSRHLEKRLFSNLKLSDFPDPDEGHPQFYITATDLRTNTSWRFSRDANSVGSVPGCAYCYKIGTSIYDYPLSDVVAASAAFPPFFSPKKIALKNLKPNGELLKNLRGMNVKERDAFERYALLGDGGIYDNLGLERAKGYRHILISNAGDPFEVVPDYERNWIAQIRGTMRHMHRQVEQRRKIHFGDLKAKEFISLFIWEIDDILDPSIQSTYDGLDDERAWKVATFPVRLKKASSEQAAWIVQHAQSLARRQIRLGFDKD